MKVTNRLFIRHKNYEITEFTLLYSDQTVAHGEITPLDGTDGEGIDQLRLVSTSVVKGRSNGRKDAIDVILDNGHVFQIPTTGNETADSRRTNEIHDRMIIEEFSRRFCRDNHRVPIEHDYAALVHQKPALANNFLVSWALGNKCNFACSYCPTWLHDGTQPWRDYELVKSFCDRLIAQVPNDKTVIIEFSGGEVTMWNDYVKLCRYLKSRGIIVSMITNGYRSLDWWQENFACFDVVHMSYHTEFARRDHFFSVCEFLKGRVDLRVYVMMPPEKAEFCQKVGSEIAEKGICVALKPITEDLLGELVAGYDHEILKMMNDFNATTGIQYVSHQAKSVAIRKDMMKQSANGSSNIVHVVELISNRENTWYGWKCYSGLEQIVIDAEGFVYRGWCKVGNKLGHVADSNFQLSAGPIICDKELCNCPFDMFSTKINPKVHTALA